MKILLIEDHPTLADISCRLLREVHDHEVTQAGSGAEALACLEHAVPDLVLVDLHLPDMNGYELAKRIRLVPKFDATVLVALTGWGNLLKEDGDEFDAHFRKPMDFDLLPTLHRRLAESTNDEVAAGGLACPRFIG
jgi:CheY-like chemotaxis protein